MSTIFHGVIGQQRDIYIYTHTFVNVYVYIIKYIYIYMISWIYIYIYTKVYTEVSKMMELDFFFDLMDFTVSPPRTVVPPQFAPLS